MIVGDVTQALVDDLLGRECGDAPEVVRAVLGLADHSALIVEFGHPDGDLAGLAVELTRAFSDVASVGLCSGCAF